MLDIPARPDTPIACDMRGAVDTPEARLQAYRDLFSRSLLAHERLPRAVALSFSLDAEAMVEELARREAACCPFLSYRVERAAGTVVWTIGGDSEPTLDAFDSLAQGRRVTLPT